MRALKVDILEALFTAGGDRRIVLERIIKREVRPVEVAEVTIAAILYRLIEPAGEIVAKVLEIPRRVLDDGHLYHELAHIQRGIGHWLILSQILKAVR